MITRSIVLKIFKTMSKKQLAKDASDKVEELLNKDLFPRIILIAGKLANNKKINPEHVENAIFAITHAKDFDTVNKYAKHAHTKIMSRQAIKKDALEILGNQKLSSKILVYLHNAFLYYIKSLLHVKTSDKKITEKHILNNLVLNPGLSYVFASAAGNYWKTLAGTSIANVEIPESHIKAPEPQVVKTPQAQVQVAKPQAQVQVAKPQAQVMKAPLNTQVYKGPNGSIETEPIYKGPPQALSQASVNSLKIPQVSPTNASQVAKAAQVSRALKEMQMSQTSQASAPQAQASLSQVNPMFSLSPNVVPEPKKIENPWNSARNVNANANKNLLYPNTEKSMFDLVKNAEKKL